MRFVKPETGYFFISTIARTPESYFLTILSKNSMDQLYLVAENILRIVPMGTHEWNQYMNP